MENKPLLRIMALLELALQEVARTPNRETFTYFDSGKRFRMPTNPLFNDLRSLKIAAEKIGNETNGSLTLEHSPVRPLRADDPGSGGVGTIVLHVEDAKVLERYYRKIQSQIDDLRNYHFILDVSEDRAKLYLDSKPDDHYPIDKDSLRFKLIKTLALSEKPIATSILANKLKPKRSDKIGAIRSTVSEIKREVREKIKNDDAADKLFSNDMETGSGYQIRNIEIIGE